MVNVRHGANGFATVDCTSIWNVTKLGIVRFLIFL